MAVVGSGIYGVSNPNISTGTLAPAMATYYEKVFLARTEYELVLAEGAQVRTHPANEGRTVNFTRMNPFTVITTPLGEMSNPVTCAINLSTVSMTLSEYGLTTYTGRFASLTSIDFNQKEAISTMGQNMRETLNQLVGAELQNGTAFYGNTHAIDTLAAGDTLDACDIRAIVQTLELNKAMKYSDGMFLGKTDPYSKKNLLADTTWVNSKTYSDVKGLYAGKRSILPLSLKFGETDNSVIPSEAGYDNIQLSILYGSLLGDGCLWKPKPKIIKRNGKQYVGKTQSYQFEEEHTDKQKEYIAWKTKMFSPFSILSEINRSFGKTHKLIIRPGRGKNPLKEQLNELHRVFYPNGKKILPLGFEKSLDKIALAVWFFDDGDLNLFSGEAKSFVDRLKLKRVARLATGNFNYKEQKRIIRTLHKKFGIQPKLIKERSSNDRKYFRLVFQTGNEAFDRLHKLLLEVKEQLDVKGMEYKTPERVETRRGRAPYYRSLRYSPKVSFLN
jgi:hypothetical protein